MWKMNFRWLSIISTVLERRLNARTQMLSFCVHTQMINIHGIPGEIPKKRSGFSDFAYFYS
jgi:hypothetical protein